MGLSRATDRRQRATRTPSVPANDGAATVIARAITTFAPGTTHQRASAAHQRAKCSVSIGRLPAFLLRSDTDKSLCTEYVQMLPYPYSMVFAKKPVLTAPLSPMYTCCKRFQDIFITEVAMSASLQDVAA